MTDVIHRCADTHGTLSQAVKIDARFGKLVVKERVSAAAAKLLGESRGYWVLKCDCGNMTKATNSTMLTAGRSTSCGCACKKAKVEKPKRIRKPSPPRPQMDVTDMRFGILTAKKSLGSDGKKQGTTWLFKCDCGKDHPARLKDVRYGNTASCGCLKPGIGTNTGIHRTPTLDINRPWRKSEQVDDRYLTLVGENAPKGILGVRVHKIR